MTKKLYIFFNDNFYFHTHLAIQLDKSWGEIIFSTTPKLFH